MPSDAKARLRGGFSPEEMRLMSIDLTEELIGAWEVSAADYHADLTHTSNSVKEVARRSILEYHGRYVAKTIRAPERTPQLVLGSVCHTCTLEPSEFDDAFAIAPKCDRRTKEGKATWEKWSHEAGHKTILTIEQADVGRRMADAIMDNSIANDLLTAYGKPEQSTRWVDPLTKMKCKCRFDWIIEDGPVADIKTSSDPTPAAWMKSVVNYGYHRQQAWYLEGRWHGLGDICTDWFFVVVGSEPPHEVVVYTLTKEAVERGRKQNRVILKELQERHETNNWTGRWSDAVQTIDLPSWGYDGD